MVPAPDKIWLRINGAATNWQPTEDPPEVTPGLISELPESMFGDWPHWLHLPQHGLVKSALLVLGINHHHDGDDILITHGWQPLLEGLGFAIPAAVEDELGMAPTARVDCRELSRDRLSRISDALSITREESARLAELEQKKQKTRLAAETAARQRGAGIEETDADGVAAAAKIDDSGPADAGKLRPAEKLLDEHEADASLWVVRKASSLRWVSSAPCRVGARMGRPEKAAPRLMKTSVNSLFPIGNYGGPQRLLTVASQSGSIRVQLGVRECTDCGRRSPFTICHNRNVPDEPTECGGRTEPIKERAEANQRRKGSYQSVNLAEILEVKRRNLGLDRIPNKVKAVKGLTSMERTPEPLEKGLLRAKNQIPVFKDGTVRFDMIDVPVTHFRPREIGTSWQKLSILGYTHDIEGEELKSDEQLLELLPQDFIASRNAEDYFIRVSHFIDELLERFYHMDPYYQVSTGEDLVGQLFIALAPHTSGGVLTRLIGWTGASAGYAHPLFHAAKRRNCDGDEDAVMLLLDGLLNFSRVILPSTRGGLMDAPLVLTTRLKPTELDKEALNVDAAWIYNRSFYEATQSQPHPSKLINSMDIVEARIETIGAMRGYGFTHDCDSLDSGPINSSYKTLETMIDKMNAQLALGQRLRAVEVRTVASSVIESHFLPDLRGNLVAFTRQKVRCVRCGESYRRMPIAGKCIKNPQDQEQMGRRGIRFTEDEGTNQCGGNLVLTVSEGAVRKYIKVMKHVIDHYGVSLYTRQRVDCLAASADSLFKNDRVKVYTLDDFL
jgi:DNA polymerase II large subunit